MAVTYFPAFGSIIGAPGLTTVFGMGTGVALVLRPPRNLYGEERGTAKTEDPSAAQHSSPPALWREEKQEKVVKPIG